MSFLIDCREKDLINVFTEKLTPAEFKTKQLELGDIMMFNENENVDNANPLLIIERKTEADLVSSILDGRFRDQKNRLIKCKQETNAEIIYIIESGKFPIKFKKNKTSALINLVFKHNFKVFYTKTVVDTFELLVNLNEKLQNGLLVENNTEMIVPKKSFKKGVDIDPFVKILLAIDGISLLSANRIFDKYKTVSELSNALGNLEIDPFKDIKLNKPVKERLLKLFT